MKNKYLLLLLVPIVLVGIFLFLRFLTPEDTWICQDGKWVKHGNPSVPMPAYPCTVNGQKVASLSETSLANPAAKNCLNKGGKLNKVQETSGELEICQFDDGSECEEWQFFREECKKGQYKSADTSHPYSGLITKKGQDFIFKVEGGVEYILKLPENYTKELKNRLLKEVNAKEPVTVLAAETPPLSKILILKGFQEK